MGMQCMKVAMDVNNTMGTYYWYMKLQLQHALRLEFRLEQGER